VIVSFRGIRGAAVEFNTYYECDRHGEVTPAGPEVVLEPERWLDGLDDVRAWRQVAPPPGPAKPRGLREGDIVGAIRAKRAPKPKWNEPLPPRNYG
jgi:hypothetical protein